MKASETALSAPRENIFLFIPNLIGYVRILLATAACFTMTTSPWTTFTLRMAAEILDYVDGEAARYLNQCTKFGAALDIVSDRCSGLYLLLILGNFYPQHLVTFQILAVVDIASHWMMMYSSAVCGSTDRKAEYSKENALLKFYYKSENILTVFCLSNELFFGSLYLLHFSLGPYLPGPWVNVSLWQAVALLSFPICATKQVVNVVQLVVASKNLAKVDVMERARQRN